MKMRMREGRTTERKENANDIQTRGPRTKSQRIGMRVAEKRIKADSVHVRETERDTRSARGAGTREERRRNRESEAERETAITNATDEIAAAVVALRDPSINHNCQCVSTEQVSEELPDFS